MSFTEPIFLIFLPVTVLLYRFFPKKARWALLLAASLLFYAWHSVYLLGLLIFSVLVSYGCARSMTAHPEKRRQASFPLRGALSIRAKSMAFSSSFSSMTPEFWISTVTFTEG